MKHLHSQQAYDVLCLMHQRRLLRRVMTAWRKDAREMAQTKAFFEQQKERETEGGEWTWPERNDPVSLMDKSVTLKVNTHTSHLPPSHPSLFIDISMCWCT